MGIYTNIISNKHYSDIQFDAFQNVSVDLKKSLSLITSDIQAAISLQNLISSYEKNLLKNIVNGDLLFDDLNNIFLESIIIGSSQRDSFKFHEILFSFSIKVPFLVSTVVREEIAINIKLVEQSVNLYCLINALINASKVSFTNSDEIGLFLTSLSNQFSLVTNANIFTKLSGEQIELIDLSSTLSDMLGFTVGFLSESEIGLPKQQQISIVRESLLTLTYKYYGNTSLRNTLAQINNLSSPFELSGDFKVLAV